MNLRYLQCAILLCFSYLWFRMLRRPRRRPRGDPKQLPVLQVPTIPLEIQYLILDLADDNLELRNLCTVCRLWRNHAQRLIFREIWVTSYNVRSLLALFRTRPDLGRCVTTLRVVESFHSEDTSPVLEQLARPLPDLMPNVHTLDLLGRKFGPDLTRLGTTAACVGITRITHLRLRSGIFTTADNMLGFIALFSRLEGLEILGHYTVVSAPAGHAPPAPRHLKYLALGRTFCSEIVLAWLGGSAVVVDELRVSGWSYRHDPFHSSLVKIGAGVTRLHLVEELQFWPSGPGAGSASFPRCPALRSLVMHLRLSTAEPSAMRAGLLSLLLRLSSPHLSTIHFEVYVTAECLRLPWDELDAALSTFGDLREVMFDLYGWLGYAGGKVVYAEAEGQGTSATYEQLCEGMKRKMVQSGARGILKFKCAGRSAVHVGMVA
ncbi:hypothetical protein C8R43DRAFT_349468 [Mycena crocata]|nr:hypothetical protein C8R43DRAFT_349468 [Mycena crocata]